MQNYVLCPKSGHENLDMICLNTSCSYKGLVCYQCLGQMGHQHMASDIIPIAKFITKCQEGMEKKAGKPEETNGKTGIQAAKEEYETSKKMINEYKIQTEVMFRQMFTEMEEEFSKKFEILLDEMEGPKNKVIHTIEKFRTYLKEMQSGLIDDTKEINQEMSNIWKVLEIDKLRTKDIPTKGPNEDKEVYFTVRKEFIKNAQATNKPELVETFKHETRKVKNFTDNMDEWVKARPSLWTPTTALSGQKPTKGKSSLESKEKVKQEIQKNKENMIKGTGNMNISGVKRPNPSPIIPKEKIKGSTPTKLLKAAQPNMILPENFDQSKFLTPGRFADGKDALFMPLNPKLLASQQNQLVGSAMIPENKYPRFDEPNLATKKRAEEPSLMRRDIEHSPMNSSRKLEDREMSSSKKLERSTSGSAKKLEQIEEKDIKYCKRLKLDDKAYQTFKYLDTHTITFKSQVDLTLLGFKHYNAYQATFVAILDYLLLEGEAADQTNDMTLPPRELATGTFRLTRDDPKSTMVNVMFKNPVKIEKQKGYTIRVVSKSKAGLYHSYKGTNGLRIAPPFMFMKSKYSDMAQVITEVNKGQIPELIYTM